MYALVTISAVPAVGFWVYLMAAVFADALAPQPGLEPDAVERVAQFVKHLPRKLLRGFVRLYSHHGRKLYHTYLRWQGYVPIRLSTRVVWQPTHTILTPYQEF